MVKQLLVLLFILLTIISISCNKEKRIVVAKIGNENIYQSQVDTIISDELFQLRAEALKSYLSKLLFEQEANKRNISTYKLRELEIITKAKKVSKADIIEYARINKIVDYDSIQIRNTLNIINQRFRFEVFIDSLRTANYVVLLNNSSYSNLKGLEKLYTHNHFNNNSILNLYFIADYNCPSCQINYERIIELCNAFNGKVQFKFVPYCVDIENSKVFFAEALALQDKFWDLNSELFKINQLTDSVIVNLIQSYSIDSSMLMVDYGSQINRSEIENNKRILENLNIFSVPTIIVDDIIIPGYTSSEELVQIINYKLLNE